MHFKILECEEQSTCKSNRRQEIFKTREEINQFEIITQCKKISETSWFFEKINQTKTHSNLPKEEKELKIKR